MWIFVTVLIVLVMVILVLSIYSKIIKAKFKVSQAKSTIDVYLTQRFDMIPSLIQCVKEYEFYKEDVFNKLIKMRSQYMQKKAISLGEKIDIEFKKIMQNLEQYQELKANEHFLNLQKNMNKIENQLKDARKVYNRNVTEYNNVICTNPSNIIAKLFMFRKLNYFESETNNN